MAATADNVADLILSERPAPHVMLIRFNRGEKRNAINNVMVVELARLLTLAAEDIDTRCVVITGDDKAFCAGADLKRMHTEAPQKGVSGVVNDPARVDAWNIIQNFPKPMIAAVNGYALGAGNELAMCCDFVVAGKNALFGQPEAKIGGMPGDGGTQRLPRKVGPNLAAYMMMTGEPIDADTAHRVGYAIEVCEVADTVNRAVEIGTRISKSAPLAVQAVKRLVHVAVGATFENGIAVERVLALRNHSTADRAEGLLAFNEKRAPNYRGV